MTKKVKTDQESEDMPDPDVETIEENLSPQPVKAEPDSSLPFTREDWMGVKTVFKCVQCGGFRNTPDEMISHLISHYPQPAPAGLREKLQELFKEN